MSFPSQPTLGFIGAGRLAKTLAAACFRRGYRIAAVASRSAESAQELAGRVQGTVVPTAQQVADIADLVFLTVTDSAIAPVAASLRYARERAGQCALVHCSGASSVALLDPARAQGVLTGGFHPLFLFSGSDADVERLAGRSITIEAPPQLDTALRALARALGCEALSIPAGGRMLYHGSANYAASFVLSALYENVMLWKHLGLDEDAVLAAVLPMLESTLQAAREKGLSGALAGPVSRGDAAIVQRQLDALGELGGDHALLYALMTRRAIELARRRDNPPPALDQIDAAVQAAIAAAGAPRA
jgi:predicted short-subunit dehydrogenase-like oxidoreductase (DUF2520 family)